MSPDQIDAALRIVVVLVVLVTTVRALNGNGRSAKERKAINELMVRVSGQSSRHPVNDRQDEPSPPDTGQTET